MHYSQHCSLITGMHRIWFLLAMAAPLTGYLKQVKALTKGNTTQTTGQHLHRPAIYWDCTDPLCFPLSSAYTCIMKDTALYPWALYFFFLYSHTKTHSEIMRRPAWKQFSSCDRMPGWVWCKKQRYQHVISCISLPASWSTFMLKSCEVWCRLSCNACCN